MVSKQTEGNIHELQNIIEQLQYELNQEKKKNEHLVRQMDEMERLLCKLRSFVKTIKFKLAATIKGNIFNRGKGLEDLDNFIKENEPKRNVMFAVETEYDK